MTAVFKDALALVSMGLFIASMSTIAELAALAM